MSARLVYLRLELKRACKKLPHIFAGAIVLLLLAGTIALLSARMLYGETSSGRITVGVVLPEGDAVAKKALAMVSSLESVKSICDFEYMNKEECLDKLKAGKLYAVMEVPEGFVQDIMNGTNTPVKILLPKGVGLESRIFKELTDAGASTLGASQAGIYAGDELLYLYGMADSVSGLEADLNRAQLYIWEANGAIHGVFVLQLGEEANYREIQGAWRSDTPYGTIHRVASDGAVPGLFAACMDFCRARVNHLRIDTHRDNGVMQHLILKHGFVPCGTIWVEDGTPRLAYEWLAEA